MVLNNFTCVRVFVIEVAEQQSPGKLMAHLLVERAQHTLIVRGEYSCKGDVPPGLHEYQTVVPVMVVKLEHPGAVTHRVLLDEREFTPRVQERAPRSPAKQRLYLLPKGVDINTVDDEPQRGAY